MPSSRFEKTAFPLALVTAEAVFATPLMVAVRFRVVPEKTTPVSADSVTETEPRPSSILIVSLGSGRLSRFDG